MNDVSDAEWNASRFIFFFPHLDTSNVRHVGSDSDVTAKIAYLTEASLAGLLLLHVFFLFCFGGWEITKMAHYRHQLVWNINQDF